MGSAKEAMMEEMEERETQGKLQDIVDALSFGETWNWTDFEIDFVESLTDEDTMEPKNYKSLSEKQQRIVHEIWDKWNDMENMRRQADKD